MNHKRKRPKNRRAGCLMCKYWKVNGFATERKDGERFSDHKRRTLEPLVGLDRRWPQEGGDTQTDG